MREFRAAWIATVGNIDWPSTNALSTARQQAELRGMLDRAVELRLNAIMLQVRPACDAVYASAFEPWSEYLTGRMGQEPRPFYDPLAFALEEAHKRGLELHAWFNPFRARFHGAKSPVSPKHISRTRPDLVRQYGKYLWLDPGEPEAQDYSVSVVMDVVRRYDIDGVHFDDYFYPYVETNASGSEIDFPDQASWQRYGVGSGLSRADWRRDNVNRFVQRVYQSVKAEKPWMRFGVSPFGIWRPGYPPQVKGFDAYAKLYADSRRWLAEGWVDYLAPELYWPIDPPAQSFTALLQWWSAQNARGRHLFAGMDDTRAANRSKPDEIINQIVAARKTAGVEGHLHWNMTSLMKNSALDGALLRRVYDQPALVPISPWLSAVCPDKPGLRATIRGSDVNLNWVGTGSIKVWLWLLQSRSKGQWRTEVLPACETSRRFHGAKPEVVSLTAVERNGNTGPAIVLQIAK